MISDLIYQTHARDIDVEVMSVVKMIPDCYMSAQNSEGRRESAVERPNGFTGYCSLTAKLEIKISISNFTGVSYPVMLTHDFT